MFYIYHFYQILCSRPSKSLGRHCKGSTLINLLKIALNPASTHPPPIVNILLSAAIKSSAEWSTFLSLSMPTQGYLARSGYNENRKLSPVPKYAVDEIETEKLILFLEIAKCRLLFWDETR